MQKIIKRYQLLQGMQLMLQFNVNDSMVTVTFQHGIRRPILVRGRFSTDDPDLQEALEADSGFNKIFHLEHTDHGEETPVFINEDVTPGGVPDNAEQIDVPPDNNEEGNNEAPHVENDADDYPEITGLQEARQKMFDLFPGEFKPANMPNKKAVLNKAKAKNITFSKLV